jgi:hypothetical protein
MSKSKTPETKLCPSCPLLSLLPIIAANRVSYIRVKEQLTPHKICRLLRAFWRSHPYVTLEGCPYFSETESMERFIHA